MSEQHISEEEVRGWEESCKAWAAWGAAMPRPAIRFIGRLLAGRKELLSLLLGVLHAGIIDVGYGLHAQECRFCSWWSRNDEDVPEHDPECEYVRTLPFVEAEDRALLELIGGTARGGRQKL